MNKENLRVDAIHRTVQILPIRPIRPFEKELSQAMKKRKMAGKPTPDTEEKPQAPAKRFAETGSNIDYNI